MASLSEAGSLPVEISQISLLMQAAGSRSAIMLKSTSSSARSEAADLRLLEAAIAAAVRPAPARTAPLARRSPVASEAVAEADKAVVDTTNVPEAADTNVKARMTKNFMLQSIRQHVTSWIIKCLSKDN